MAVAFYLGQRLSYDGALCTVRYQGPLAGLKGDWLGVEWDQPERGKHNGSHQGKKIFNCLSKSGKAASFIRPARKQDTVRTVQEALEFKYGSRADTSTTRRSSSSNSNNTSGYLGAEIVHISGKVVEEIGFDKVQRQLSDFEALQIVLLDGLQVVGLSRSTSGIHDAAAKFAVTCPNITEIDVGWNLIEEWQDVADICRNLTKLQILKASALRLRSVSVENPSGAFSKIQELHLNETLLKPDQVLQILAGTTRNSATTTTTTTTTTTAFPLLKTLSLSSNELETFTTSYPELVFPTVTSLILDNNWFTSLAAVIPSIRRHFPLLASLSLQSNRISDLGFDEKHALNTITHLALSWNRIGTFEALSVLPTVFPNLASLVVSSNPFFTSLASSAAGQTDDTAYYLTLARIPSLKTLNYTTITARDRTEGELYYLSVADRAIRSSLAAAATASDPSSAKAYVSEHYSRYSALCRKYDRIDLLGSSASSTTTPTSHPGALAGYPRTAPPAGSIASRLVTCTFYISSPSSSSLLSPDEKDKDKWSWTHRIPKTASVYHLKALVHKHFSSSPSSPTAGVSAGASWPGGSWLGPLQFKLVYTSATELDPVGETTRNHPATAAAAAAATASTKTANSNTSTSSSSGTSKEEEWARWGDFDCDVTATPTPSPTLSSTSTSTSTRTSTSAGGAQKEKQEKEKGRWIDGIRYDRDGSMWKRREAEIVDGPRPWGDYLDDLDGEMDDDDTDDHDHRHIIRIRVEPKP